MKNWLKIKAAIGYIVYPVLLKFSKNVVVYGRIKIKGFPYIHTVNKSKIYIYNNVMLNSSNYGYHVNMYCPVKLFADGDNSEIYIGENTRIHGSCIHARSKIIIGKNCLIASNCQIIDSNGHIALMKDPENRINTVDDPLPIVIGDNVWIGAGVYILKGVNIGNGSVIAAGSVVTESIPTYSMAIGIPARVIKSL